MSKKRIQKVKCLNRCGEINVNEEIELGNFDKIGDYKYIYCPVCGLEILV